MDQRLSYFKRISWFVWLSAFFCQTVLIFIGWSLSRHWEDHLKPNWTLFAVGVLPSIFASILIWRKIHAPQTSGPLQVTFFSILCFCLGYLGFFGFVIGAIDRDLPEILVGVLLGKITLLIFNPKVSLQLSPSKP